MIKSIFKDYEEINDKRRFLHIWRISYDEVELMIDWTQKNKAMVMSNKTEINKLNLC